MKVEKQVRTITNENPKASQIFIQTHRESDLWSDLEDQASYM